MVTAPHDVTVSVTVFMVTRSLYMVTRVYIEVMTVYRGLTTMYRGLLYALAVLLSCTYGWLVNFILLRLNEQAKMPFR